MSRESYSIELYYLDGGYLSYTFSTLAEALEKEKLYWERFGDSLEATYLIKSSIVNITQRKVNKPETQIGTQT